MAIEIVDLPIKNCDFSLCESFLEGTNSEVKWLWSHFPSFVDDFLIFGGFSQACWMTRGTDSVMKEPTKSGWVPRLRRSPWNHLDEHPRNVIPIAQLK